MKPRVFGLLVAVLTCAASEARAQGPSLAAFHSERELTRFLRSLEPPPAKPCPPAPTSPAGFPTTQATWEGSVITGRVTNAQGQPEPAVLVRIVSLNVGASTAADGTYRLVVPGSRFSRGSP